MRLISCHKWATLVGMLTVGEVLYVWRQGVQNIWENSTFHLIFL